MDIPDDWPDRAFSRFVELDGIRWHVQQQGRGPVLLLVHGTGGSTHSWASCTGALSHMGTVVSVDLPGHGFSHVPVAVERASNAYALASMARSLGRLLQHLQLLPSVAVGHSAGMAVLLRMTLDGEIAPKMLLGVCPALVAPPAWYVAFVAPVLGALVESDAAAHGGARLAADTRIVKRMLDSTGSALTAPQLARYELLCRKPEHIHAALTMMARWNLPELLRDAVALRTPVQLLAGKQDRWVPIAPLTRAVAGLVAVQLEAVDGGHLLAEEKPNDVIRKVEGGLINGGA